MSRSCTELDKLYAASKIVFLAWPDDPQMEEERNRLESEIEGRGLRVFPESIAEFESDVRLREALEQCTTSVHLFGDRPGDFDLRQWDAAVRLGKPCVLASRSATETRRGPAGSPAPIYLNQGNPTIAIAKAIEQIAGHRQARRTRGPTIAGQDARLPGFQARCRCHARVEDPKAHHQPRTVRSHRAAQRRARGTKSCRAPDSPSFAGRKRAATGSRANSRHWTRAMADLGSVRPAARLAAARAPMAPPAWTLSKATRIVRSEEALDVLLTQVQGAAA